MQAAFEPQQVARALDGDRRALQTLVQRLLPVLQAEVGYTMLREARSEGRDPQEEVRDLVQEVFVSLLADRGKTLRSWDPARGRSLDSFARLVARRQVRATLRSVRRSPWTELPVAGDELALRVVDGLTPAQQFESCETLARLLERLDQRLDERGMRLFAMLYVEGRSVEEVMAAVDMSRDAVYAWRLRFRKLAASLARAAESQPATATAPRSG
ncbi:RNA polymerase sigma factor SigD [Enhygromyxa salina]|uniref:RNA polymerase sigma factor SigD n=1 Tax=Enhygromyxa salina TaxID=215803 RepID=A0A2S9YBQ7_9BACT|nr:sigma-70 family RNA polymerase sigma factor [Enhygromyxa salina]PRQ02533.1 RNA polymerase sigma factor SigD [Enhygromyxa salina]